MSFHQFKKKQFIPIPNKELWGFISNPKNLKEITPDYMGFDITSDLTEEQMYEGMIISYKVSPILGIKTTWVTEITHIKTGEYFVDEQRIGPYKLWHHEHILEPKDGGTLMTDIVSYKVPFGLLGMLLNSVMIKKKLEEIFDYRRKTLIKLFGDQEI